MKINCGPTPETRRKMKLEKLTNWHRKFAWLPIRAGENDCRWLEFYERKGTFNSRFHYIHYFWTWEYRFKEKK